MYEIRDHTADIGIRVAAASLADLLVDAARGLTAVVAGDQARIRPLTTDTFVVAGTDPAWLLRDWVAEVLAAFDVRRMLYCDFEVTVEDVGMRASARGERYDPVRHALAHEVKAVTLHDLDVHPTPSGWEGSFILDI